MPIRRRYFQVRLTDDEAAALERASQKNGLTRSEVVRLLILATAADAISPSMPIVVFDRPAALGLVRNVRALGYLMNQSTRALNGIAKSCRTQEIETDSLEEVLLDVSSDLKKLAVEVSRVEKAASAILGFPIVRM